MEIEFRKDTEQRKSWFMKAAFSHPAKMSLPLQLWIIENYTKPGDIILDPMAGSGTLMVSCSLGRHCILVELEPRYIKMATNNWNKVSMMHSLEYPMGNCTIIQGDARHLDKLLVDHIITSPPYSTKQVIDKKFFAKMLHDQGGRNVEQESAGLREEPQDPNNIANLPYGDIDSVVVSPPYENSVSVNDSKQDDRARRLADAGYDAKQFMGGTGRQSQQDFSYRPDKIITSPPYENAIHKQDASSMFDETLDATKQNFVYGQTKDNIGNLKGGNYLQAMFEVYAQCYKILKQDGLLILVTKNLIRDKQPVRLDLDTIKLCEKCGFYLFAHHYRKLPAQGVFRNMYHKKYPDVKLPDKEDILVFSKTPLPPDEI